MQTVIEARSLSKIFEQKHAVKDVHFEVQKGQCFGIIGANGAGKSTLLKMLYGLSPISSGELFVLGLNAREDFKEIKKRIAVVQENMKLDPDFTPLDNLFIFGRLHGFKPKSIAQNVHKIIRDFGIEEFSCMHTSELSDFVVQKFLLARALMVKPEIIFLDEPVTGLSAKERSWYIEKIKELTRSGITVVVTTRNLLSAEEIFDQIIILNNGKIVVDGAPNDLILEYIGPDVVEFDVKINDVDYYVKKIEGKYSYQVINNKLKLFLKNGQNPKIAIEKVSSHHISLRPANLEDVLLRLAGLDLGA